MKRTLSLAALAALCLGLMASCTGVVSDGLDPAGGAGAGGGSGPTPPGTGGAGSGSSGGRAAGMEGTGGRSAPVGSGGGVDAGVGAGGSGGASGTAGRGAGGPGTTGGVGATGSGGARPNATGGMTPPPAGTGGAVSMGTGGTNVPATGIQARGVQISLVQASQGTAVALSGAQGSVPVAERNAVLIEGRPMLVRVHTTVAAGWTARPILAVLTITPQGGVARQFTVSRMVTASSTAAQLASTFNFILAASDVTPGMSLQVELQEATTSSAPLSDPPPRFPLQGSVDLGITAGLMELQVVIVPAQTSGGFPISTDERRKNLHDHLFDIYPVQNVAITWHDPVPLTGEISTSTAFALLRDLCMKEGARPSVIYHMILRDADGGLSAAGTASGSNSATRGCRAVSLTSVSGAMAYIDGNVDTVAHELGHNHGRGHVDCGDPASPDPAFPYPDGFLGADGYSIIDNVLKPTSQFKELMSYCRPRWVSDWMWNRFVERIRMSTTWKLQTPFLASEEGHSLSGYVESNGTARWAVLPGHLPEASVVANAFRTGEIDFTDGKRLTVPIAIIPSSEPGLVEVVANLPAGPLPASARIVVAGRSHLVDFSSIPHY